MSAKRRSRAEASRLSLADRFWPFVDTSGGPDACWPWTDRRDGPEGYGRIYVPKSCPLPGLRLMDDEGAHRVAYALAHGGVTPGLFVLHSCDHRPCCNAAHLREGTTADNLRDAAERGRTYRGERFWSAKLTEDDVREIRSRHAAGESANRIAKDYPVSVMNTYYVVKGQSWRWVEAA